VSTFELAHQALQIGGDPGQVVGGRLGVVRSFGRAARGLGDPGDVAGDFVAPLRRLRDIAADLAGRGRLFFHRAGDGILQVVDLVDDLADLLDGLDRAGGVVLDRLDLAADILGRLAVCLASSLTSLATTANPLPASPARAASMVALRASRFVCWAIVVMTLMTLPISVLLSPKLGDGGVGLVGDLDGRGSRPWRPRERSWRSP